MSRAADDSPQRFIGAEVASSQTVNVYTDNVSKDAAKNALSTNTIHLSASTLGFSPNVPDEIFFEALASLASPSIVITADTGRDMKSLMYKYRGRICVITTSIKGKHQELAFKKLVGHHRFRNYSLYPNRFRRIHLSKSGTNLELTLTKVNGQLKRKTFKRVFG